MRVCPLTSSQASKGLEGGTAGTAEGVYVGVSGRDFVGASLSGSTEATKLLGGEWMRNVYSAF